MFSALAARWRAEPIFIIFAHFLAFKSHDAEMTANYRGQNVRLTDCHNFALEPGFKLSL